MISDKLDEACIHSLVMQSLEGPPKDTACLAFKKGKGTLKDILKALDKLYRRSASYVHLQSEMCNIQQLYKESAQDYYKRLIRLQVAIQDKYPKRLHDLELERTVQEAFYNRLHDEYKPMIVHMLENPDVTVGDLVEAVRKVESVQERCWIQRQDASRYPPSTSTSYHKPAFHKGKDKDKKDDKGNDKGVIKAKATQIESEVGSDTDEFEDSDAERSANENALWRDGYYCYAVCHAEQTEQGGGPATKAQKVKPAKKTPYWNDDPRACWLGPLNLGNTFIDGNWMKVLLDDGSQINSITLAYAKSLDLVVGPLEYLAGNPSGQPIQGIGGVRTGAIGYVVFCVQIEGILGYNEEQVALVVDESSAFARKVPIILGTPTLHRVVNCMKESEMEKAPLEWENVCMAYEMHH